MRVSRKDAKTQRLCKFFTLRSLRLCAGLSCLLALGSLLQAAQDPRREEEAADYFRKWLDETVVYIITDEERQVFQSLSTDQEKEQFIEQFWLRRDPDPRTPANEFKEEHFRRIAHANEHFSAGKPGWKTDRGRIYIVQGPPAEIESHPAGGYYRRGLRRGGGETAAYPFEIWRYRHIEGLGSDVELEFVDPTLSDQYTLALDLSEKDALLHAGGGATLHELMGIPDGRGRLTDHLQRGFYWSDDNPFERYRTFSQVQRPSVIEHKDLQELVQVDVSYQDLPLLARGDHFRLDAERLLVPVTLQVDNKDLTFRSENGVSRARLAVYGVVTSLNRQTAAEFEDDLQVAYSPSDLQAGLKRSSIYQKIVVLDAHMRYRLDLVVKDLFGGKVGVVRRSLAPPELPEGRLCFSSVLISDSAGVLDEIPQGSPMFVLGNVKVRPNLAQAFRPDTPLSVYFQLYNASVSSSDGQPDLALRYRILQGGRLLQSLDDLAGTSIRMSSPQRIVVLRQFAVEDLAPGEYDLGVEAQDRLAGQSASTRLRFRILDEQ